MKTNKMILPIVAFSGFLIFGSLVAFNQNEAKANVVNATNDITITGRAALCAQDGNNFSFTLNQQNLIPNDSSKFSLSDASKITLTRNGTTYNPVVTSSLMEKGDVKPSISAFKFSFTSAFDMSAPQDKDVLHFDNAQFVRTNGDNRYVVNVTDTTFTYSAENGWSCFAGEMGTVSEITGNDPSNKNLRFTTSATPDGFPAQYQDFRMYAPVNNKSGLFINNVQQENTKFTILDGNIFYTSFESLVIYDKGSKTPRSTFADGDILRFEGEYQLLLKNSDNTREKENSYFKISEPLYFTVKNGKFEKLTPEIHEVHGVKEVVNNAINYWFELSDDGLNIPDNTSFSFPNTQITLARGNDVYTPNKDIVNNGASFIKNRPGTAEGYFFAIQNSWFGGQQRTLQKNDVLTIGGDAMYKDSDGKLIVLRIKPFESCYDGSKMHLGHQKVVTKTFSEDYSTCEFDVVCSSCDKIIGHEVVDSTYNESISLCLGKITKSYSASVTIDDVEYTNEYSVQEDYGEPLGHLLQDHSYSWSDDNLSCTAKDSCVREGCDYFETVTVDSIKQTVEEPTCTEKGLDTYTAVFDDDIHETQSKNVDVDPLGHDFSTPTWTWNEDYSECNVALQCSRCEASHSDAANVTSSVTTNQSCENHEITTYVATITYENKEYKDIKEIATKDPLGHSYGEVTYVWADDLSSCTASRDCLRPGCEHTESEQKNSLTRIDEQPTCTNDGAGIKFVDFDNPDFARQEANIVIPKLGHNYSVDSVSWNDDLTEATIVIKCGRCNETQTLQADVSSSILIPQTCSEDEVTSYVASASFEGETYFFNKNVVTKQASEHTYEFISWEWDRDNLAATIKYKCASCNETFSQVVNATTVITKAPSEEEEGIMTCTVKITLGGQEYTDNKQVSISKLKPVAVDYTPVIIGSAVGGGSLVAALGAGAFVFIKLRHKKMK